MKKILEGLLAQLRGTWIHSIKSKKYNQLRISLQHILTSSSIVLVASTFIKRFPTASFR
jgi:hypothetical protein